MRPFDVSLRTNEVPFVFMCNENNDKIKRCFHWWTTFYCVCVPGVHANGFVSGWVFLIERRSKKKTTTTKKKHERKKENRKKKIPVYFWSSRSSEAIFMLISIGFCFVTFFLFLGTSSGLALLLPLNTKILVKILDLRPFVTETVPRYFWCFEMLLDYRSVSIGFLLDFTGFYWVWLGFTGLYLVIMGLTGFECVLLAFIGFYWVLLGFTGFYWVLLFFYWVLLGFTGFYWALLGLSLMDLWKSFHHHKPFIIIWNDELRSSFLQVPIVWLTGFYSILPSFLGDILLFSEWVLKLTFLHSCLPTLLRLLPSLFTLTILFALWYRFLARGSVFTHFFCTRAVSNSFMYMTYRFSRGSRVFQWRGSNTTDWSRGTFAIFFADSSVSFWLVSLIVFDHKERLAKRPAAKDGGRSDAARARLPETVTGFLPSFLSSACVRVCVCLCVFSCERVWFNDTRGLLFREWKADGRAASLNYSWRAEIA